MISIDVLNASLFTVAAVVLLGSPGPAIAALVAVGRGEGFLRGLRFYGGLQVGLAVAAGISAAGLFSAVQAFPAATVAMSAIATAYLIYLAYQIATAPVGVDGGPKASGFASTPFGGFLLGLTNPKAYVAFASLMASYSIVRSSASIDAAFKWLSCVIIMILVDIAWLWIGVVLQKANLTPKAERALNFIMGATVLVTALLALI